MFFVKHVIKGIVLSFSYLTCFAKGMHWLRTCSIRRHLCLIVFGLSFFLLIPFAASAPGKSQEENFGLVGDWENTGVLLEQGQVISSLRGVGIGFGAHSTHVSIAPLMFALRIPNLSFKQSIAGGKSQHFRLALSVGARYILRGASDSYFFTDGDQEVLNEFQRNIAAFPIALAFSLFPSNWLRIHLSATAMPLFGLGRLNTMLVGNAMRISIKLWDHVFVSSHLLNHTVLDHKGALSNRTLFGASVQLMLKTVFLRVGRASRQSSTIGAKNSPMLLFDAGLLF